MDTNLDNELIEKLAKLKVKNPNRLNKAKRNFANKHRVGMISNADLLSIYRKQLKAKKIKQNPELELLLTKRKVRTMSGVAPVAVLTKPYKCPGKCAFCPDEKAMPKSYLSNEPAVMRAILTQFDPYKQVTARIRALTDNGHNTDKIELIIMGGTWSYFPKQYQSWYIKRCFDACNRRKCKTIEQAHQWNEKAKHRIVALTVETRPDYVTEKDIIYWRKLGATKVELGIQIADDKVLKKNDRGHDVQEIIKATTLLRQAGFKIAYHLMPNLPGSTPAKDLAVFKKLFSNEGFQPDLIKIYPTVVTKNSKIFEWWQKGLYKPYKEKTLFELLLKMKLAVPEYVRIIRLIRDIPKESIEAGNQITNLREALQTELKNQGKRCRCIRCREIKDQKSNIKKAKLSIIKYKANQGEEQFLQFTNTKKDKLFAFLRLRLPNHDSKNFIPEIQDCAMIREIHTYGKLA
ncbi:tRNA uridine(34) 5-carboxymethylaminomethyl modification radical SAM/GNAT enzyme Elp3, partial [Candidatus Falkowbacteria bacterium]|nr:tRNA uridine(34) 5-carboxymethylaminomethyl modification radical SAM/GNAT enzyme Elp3 [Candidatus Falkowbacteria bacterium]